MRTIIFVLSICSLLIGGCSAALAKTTTSKPTAKQVIYSACMSTETKISKEKSENEAVTHYFCHIVAGACVENPEADPCKKSLKKFDLALNEKGESLLLKIAFIGDHSIAEAMINAGVNIDFPIKGITNTPFGAGWTPLLIAVAERNEEVASLLVNNGANVNAKNKLGKTPIIFASHYGFHSIAKMLLENGANVDEIPNDENGWTAIIAASYKGHEDIVRMLLIHGADKNILDKNGKTALMWAEEQGNTKIVEILKGSR